jgi:hypothetical protein
MAKFLTVHEETNVDRVVIETRWTEISRERRADWQMTLFNLDQGKRFCEWDAPNAEVIEQIFHEFGIKWSEIPVASVADRSRKGYEELLASTELRQGAGRPRGRRERRVPGGFRSP